MAAVVGLNHYHFARQFNAATGLPPHQYVIARRIERANELLQAGTALFPAEVALHAGFSDQSTDANTAAIFLQQRCPRGRLSRCTIEVRATAIISCY
jgi:AraC-like DNA-binding protein